MLGLIILNWRILRIRGVRSWSQKRRVSKYTGPGHWKPGPAQAKDSSRHIILPLK